MGLRFFVWIFASLFATAAPKALRPRLAAWLEQPVLLVPELRTMIRTATLAYRVRRPAPLPLTDDELATIRTPLYLALGKRTRGADEPPDAGLHDIRGRAAPRLRHSRPLPTPTCAPLMPGRLW